MAEDSGQEKTESASPKKLQDARERGNVPRSQDLSGAAVLLAGLIALKLFGPKILTTLMGYLHRNIESMRYAEMTQQDFFSLTTVTLTFIAQISLPFLLFTMVVAIIINLVQFGFLLSWTKLMPSADKVKFNVFKWAFELFQKKALMRLAMGIGKVMLVLGIGYFAMMPHMPNLIITPGLELGQFLVLVSNAFMDVSIRVALLLLLLGIIDFIYQKYQHSEDLKMTKQEVKDEMKQMEGDTQTKGKRQAMARQQLMTSMLSDAEQADVIVTNPTEYAVALSYKGDQFAAPQVVAKGRNLIAQKIRAIALENNVTIVSNPPLARELFRTVEVGDLIPEKLYQAVSEILGMVYTQQGRKVTS